MKPTYEELETKCAALAAENAGLKALARGWANATDDRLFEEHGEIFHDSIDACEEELKTICPTTDAFLAEVRAQAHKEGAHFVANRMLAAWDAGFIDDTAKNAADIARMILTSTEFMADAPEGDFDRCFADGVLEDIGVQLRKEAAQ
ncbi:MULTISPECIES: ead/Ea22-like family protein [unclassified Enterobacter]|uniref:ead/Ea22-like family protein n=1 Tax=unclassified Enterobacter TaxID=2608935 RepID=UPI0037869B6A